MDDSKYGILLNAINKRKDVLFAQFSKYLTHKHKENAWLEVLEETKAHGYSLVPDSTKLPGWKYIRDTVWSANLKTRTLQKRDQMLICGNKEGKRTIHFTPINLQVLDILGETVDRPSIQSHEFMNNIYCPDMIPQPHIPPSLTCCTVIPASLPQENSRQFSTEYLSFSEKKEATTPLSSLSDSLGPSDPNLMLIRRDEQQLKRRSLELDVEIKEKQLRLMQQEENIKLLKKQKLMLKIDRLNRECTCSRSGPPSYPVV